jgi:predicted PurR-regulated permease PerM
MENPNKTSQPLSMLTLASIAVVIAALYLAKGVLVSWTLAVLLSFLLSPVCDWLERRWLGRIPAVLVTAILGFTMLGVLTWTAAVQITSLAPKIPEYQSNVEAKLSSVNAFAVAALRKVTSTAQEMGEKLSTTELADASLGTIAQPYPVRVVTSPASPLQMFGGMFGTLLEVLSTTGIVIVLVVFFLMQREDLRDRFIHLVGKGHVTVTTQMLEDAGVRVSRYLSMLFLLNAKFGILV